MQSARVRSTSLHDALAPQQQRLPTAGKIRPGIQVLTKAAREQIPHAVEIYQQGKQAGASLADIEKTLKAANPKFTRRPLTPRNVPYFRVTQADFATPGAATKILERYGSDHGDGNGKQLYSFPVVFPSDDLDVIFREQFEAWKASELFRWSESRPDDGQLQCMKRQAVNPDQSKRRRWGGRPTESIGSCNPNDCDLFGAGQCKHMGSLYFWIPGVSGVGLIELSFTSVYASLGVTEIIDMVRAGLGRIKGTLNGKPIFRISKMTEDVSMMDWERGKASRQKQHIIRLEADGLDMAHVLAQQELAQNAQSAPASAPRLTGPDDTSIDSASPPPTSGVDAGTPSDTAPPPAQESESVPNDSGPVSTGTNGAPEHDAVKDLRAELAGVLKVFNPPWTGDDLKEWLEGNGYQRKAVHSEELLREIITRLKASQTAPGHPEDSMPQDEMPQDSMPQDEMDIPDPF